MVKLLLQEFNSPGHSDWHAPGRIEDRIDELVVPMLEQMGGTGAVDLVQLHSGMWDVVRRRAFCSRPQLTNWVGAVWDAGRQDALELDGASNARTDGLVAGSYAANDLSHSVNLSKDENR